MFICLSKKGSLLIGKYDEKEKKIVNKERVEFKAGDCIFLKYGTLHAGDANKSGFDNYKVFLDIHGNKVPANDSQLWVIEGTGGGYTKNRE